MKRSNTPSVLSRVLAVLCLISLLGTSTPFSVWAWSGSDTGGDASQGPGGAPGSGSSPGDGLDGGGTDGSGDGGDGDGDGGDSDGDGQSDAAESAASQADADSVAAAATAAGVEGLSVEATDTTQDPHNAMEGTVSVNGQTMSVDAAMSAIGAMAAANEAGLSPATGPTSAGYNTDATLSAHAEGTAAEDSVVGNMTGVTGPAEAVAHAEVDAAIGYSTATAATNSLADALGLGIADSFGYTGPSTASVTDAPTAMGMVSTAAMGFPSMAQASLPGSASMGFDLGAVAPTSVSTQSIADDTPTNPQSSFQGTATNANDFSPTAYSGFFSADAFDNSPMAQSFENAHTPLGVAVDLGLVATPAVVDAITDVQIANMVAFNPLDPLSPAEVEAIAQSIADDMVSVEDVQVEDVQMIDVPTATTPTGIPVGLSVHVTNDLDAYNAYLDAIAPLQDALAKAVAENDDEAAISLDTQISDIGKSMFSTDAPNISYAPDDNSTEADTDTQTAEPTGVVSQAVEAVTNAISTVAETVANSFNNAVEAVANALGFNTNPTQNTQTAQNNNQQVTPVSVISMTQAEMDAMLGPMPSSQPTSQNNQNAPTNTNATPVGPTTDTAPQAPTDTTPQSPTTDTAPTAPTDTTPATPTTDTATQAPTDTTPAVNDTPSALSPTPMGPAQSFSPQNNQQVDTTSYTDQAGNTQVAQSRPETQDDRDAGGQPGYSQQAYEGPESRQQAIDLVAAIAVFENPANPASVAENVVARAQNQNQFPNTVTGVIGASNSAGTVYAYEPVGNFNGNLSAMVEAAKNHPSFANAQRAAAAVLAGATTPQTVVIGRNGKAQVATHFVNPAVVQQRGASQSTQSWVNSVVNNPASVTVQGPGNTSHVHGIPAGEPGGQNLSPQPTVNEIGTTPVAPSAGFSAGTLGASPATPGEPAATPVETTTAPPTAAPQATTPNEQTAAVAEGVLGAVIDVAIGGPAAAVAQQGIGFLAQVLGGAEGGSSPSGPTPSNNPPASRVVMANQKATHRKQGISATLQAQLQYAAQVANVTFVVTSGGQPSKSDVANAKGKGMEALVGSRTGSSRHDHGNAADGKLVGADGRTLSFTNPNDLPTFQTFIRAAVAAGATGVGAGIGYMGPQTIHVGGGSALSWGAGGKSSKAPGWLAEAHRQGLNDAKTFDPKNLTTVPSSPAPAGSGTAAPTGPSISVSVPGANVTVSLPGLGGPSIGQQIASFIVNQVMQAAGGQSGANTSPSGAGGTPASGGQPSAPTQAATPQSILDRIKAIIDAIMGDWLIDSSDNESDTASSTPSNSSSTAQTALVINAANWMIRDIWQWFSGAEVKETYTNLPVARRASQTDEPPYIPIVIRIDETNGTIEMEELPVDDDLYLEENTEEVDDSASLALGMDGSIIYSDGTYAPVYNNGQMIDTGVNYVYLIERYRDGVLISSEINDEGLPGNFFTRAVGRFFSNTSPFTLEQVATVTYSTVDPDIKILDDEYRDYLVTLMDGSTRRVTVPVTTSLEFYAESFIDVGYQGDVNALISLGVEVSKKVTEHGPNIVERLGLMVSKDKPASPYANLPNIDTLTTNRNARSTDIDAVNIYLDTDLNCPAGYAPNDAYLYQITTPLGQVFGAVCGTGRSDSYAAAIAKEMNRRGYFEDQLTGRGLLPKMRFYFNAESSPITLSPEATTTVTTLPNTTNEISFEVKAVGSQGQTLIDWTNAASISIGSSVQLYFRWNGTAYQQCLAFLNDNGDYALRVTNRAMTTGNTESERYDVREASTTYRIECGGQRNNEFGVDDRSIRVLIQ